ncbi:MAG: MoaF N-terminal domain-containing protein [Oscillospiraceae bacterium]|jgi:hypothetical protein|nr:MoaF N-terminal domain-containing protein [Oscillospiraceae bacterium]
MANLAKEYAPKAGALSIGQYCPPLSFELAGKKFDLKMDYGENGGDYTLNFLDEKKVEWSIKGGAPKVDEYKCLKGDDYTYLVSWCVKDPADPDAPSKENHTWVIDKEQGLVTFLRCAKGENQYWPYLIESHFTFGAIREAGKTIGTKRHGFSDDVIGTCVQWTYGCELSTVHVYYNTNWYRITYPRDAVKSDQGAAQNDQLNSLLKDLPGSDEPSYYIKIKEGMYLISLTEQNMERYVGDKVGFRSDTLCFLDNYNRMYDIGRGYGTSTFSPGAIQTDGKAPDEATLATSPKEGEIFVMIGAYGKPGDVDDHFFTDPNPYLV